MYVPLKALVQTQEEWRLAGLNLCRIAAARKDP